MSAEDDRKSEAARVVSEFKRLRADHPDQPLAVSVLSALTCVIGAASTMQELSRELDESLASLKRAEKSTSINAACDLFSQYVTRVTAELPDFEQRKAKLMERCARFAEVAADSRKKISQFGDRFIRDGKVVLVHGRSRVVTAVLKHAAQQGKQFSVIMTEGRPAGSGYFAARELIDAGILVTLILDSAVAFAMERVDMVLVGAEGVVESGGIINLIGTYQIAMVAKALKRPLYVAAESYKFVRLFPLQQTDVPNAENGHGLPSLQGVDVPAQLSILNPGCDYTPPEFITLLFTDIGILTPPAISDELIKLYY